MQTRRFRPTLEVLEARELLTLTAPVLYGVGTTNDPFIPNAAPRSVVTAVLTGNGKLDLIEAHTSDSSVYVLLGNGDGTFKAPIKTAVGEAIQGDVFVGDFNGDGKPDLFLPSAAPGNPAIVLLGNGDGTFQPRIDSSSFDVSGYYPRGWAVGDFTGDGKLDIACTLPSNSLNSGRYEVLPGNGDGTFGPAIVGPAVLGYARWVAAGDFTGNGKLDLAVADGQQVNGSPGNAELTILLGNGDGTFNLGGHYASPGLPSSDNLNPEGVVVADLTGNGKLDAIVSNYDDNINVFLGNGDGTFQPARGISPGQYPRSVNIADLNRDGKMDLVVTGVGIGAGGAEFNAEGYKPGVVSVLLGNGDGTFQSPISYSPFDYPGWTAVGDFKGNGYPDLATTQVFDGHALAVLLNDPSSNNLPPVLTADPSASFVTGKAVNLSATATDDGGAANLTYAWSTVVSPPGPITFSANGTNAARNTTATWSAPGTYYFEVKVTDAAGLSTIGTTAVTLTSLGGTPAAIYVSNVYKLLLNRAPDAGAQAWVNMLNSGVSPSTFVRDIEQSPEYRTDVVMSLYQHYLGRGLDGGAQGWINWLAGGATIEAVTAAIVGSPEYFAKHGGSATGFVQGLYQDVLGRTGSAGDVQGWTNALSSGVSPAQVAMGFLTSTECRAKLVDSDYTTFLLRPADPGGQAAWVQALASGMTDQAILAAIFGSPEGFAKWS